MKISLLICSAAVALSFLLSLSCSVPQSEDRKFEAFAKEYLDKLLEKNPELATSLGEHRYDDRLSDYSQAGIQANYPR
jgi:hypothetical protein